MKKAFRINSRSVGSYNNVPYVVVAESFAEAEAAFYKNIDNDSIIMSIDTVDCAKCIIA